MRGRFGREYIESPGARVGQVSCSGMVQLADAIRDPHHAIRDPIDPDRGGAEPDVPLRRIVALEEAVASPQGCAPEGRAPRAERLGSSCVGSSHQGWQSPISDSFQACRRRDGMPGSVNADRSLLPVCRGAGFRSLARVQQVIAHLALVTNPLSCSNGPREVTPVHRRSDARLPAEQSPDVRRVVVAGLEGDRIGGTACT